VNATVHVSPPEKLVRPAMREADPCTFVIFGATGDLTRRKLLPALYELYGAGGMNSHCEIIGTGRTPLSNEQFRERVRDAFAESKDAVDTNDAQWRGFEQQLSYIPGDPSEPALYSRLATELEIRRNNGGSPNCLFYIATPSSLARPIVEGLGAAGLATNDLGWTRIVIEKPFGHDLQSGQELNRVVNGVFAEDAIFRIDHYLGKETVQNILVFRFGNTMLEPVWNRNYIEYVEITAAESLGVGSRAAFYEEAGALRDMVTNHLLQLLVLTAMEPPVALDADALRDQKVQLLRAMRPMTADEVKQRTVRGQYGSDWRAAGRRVSRGIRRAVEFQHGHVRRHRLPRRQLAVGGSAILRSHGKTPGGSAHRNSGAFQAHTTGALRARTSTGHRKQQDCTANPA
jgi:glucose-6-phosphate 1-dehydrogenase